MCTEIGFRRAILIARWLADRQQGTVARRQLLERGISATVIHRLVARGFLISVHRGVYLVGHRALARYAREMAAALACGRCAVVSHRSAASMLELLPYPAQADVWISVPSGDRRFKPGIRVYRATLEPNEVGHIDGVPVTSPARTIFDLAAIADDEQLEGAVASGRVKGLVRESDLVRLLERHRGRRGVGRLRSLLDREAEPAFTRSRAEVLTLRLVREAGRPEPETNKVVCGVEVDLLWRSERIVVEFDSWEFHSDRESFERDRAKSNELQLAGYLVIRVTWRELTRRPHVVRQRLEAALSARRQRNLI